MSRFSGVVDAPWALVLNSVAVTQGSPVHGDESGTTPSIADLWAQSASQFWTRSGPSPFVATGTSNGLMQTAPISPASQNGKAIRAIKTRSGLTWGQLAQVFGVSRRAAHGWASGSRLSARNSEILARVEKVVAACELIGDPNATRTAILGSAEYQQLVVTSSIVVLRESSNPFDTYAVRHVTDRPTDSGGEGILLADLE